jgi:peptide methionine sulfoxide reductase msrA/msrB
MYNYIALIFLIMMAVLIVQSDILPERKLEKATFAGGCFWCMVHPYDRIDGVVEVITGYTGGGIENPTYEEVSGGKTGHIEAVQITYDPSKIPYEKLLEVFWRQIDPTDTDGQFADRGTQYRTAIYYHSEDQRLAAEISKKNLYDSGRFGKPVATKIIKAEKFWKAEDSHQNYYRNNPQRYKSYRFYSGRESFLLDVWGEDKNENDKGKKINKPGIGELKKKLTPLQYNVTQECGTESAFNNEYWNNTKEGIYVDIVSGEPLFLSSDKFDSGTGWPSFTRPVEPGNIVMKKDGGHFMTRTEVRSKRGDSHLGHVFDDGPGPEGLRYCMNSASLRFIPKDNMVQEGYGKYLKHFTKTGIKKKSEVK